MHPVREKPTEEQISEHAKRVAWNETTIRKLGLTLVKSSVQVKSMKVQQGELSLYNDFTTHNDHWANYAMHKNLETFLLGYLANLEGIVEKHQIDRLIYER